jgi:hypothetical protein
MTFAEASQLCALTCNMNCRNPHSARLAGLVRRSGRPRTPRTAHPNSRNQDPLRDAERCSTWFVIPRVLARAREEVGVDRTTFSAYSCAATRAKTGRRPDRRLGEITRLSSCAVADAARSKECE